MEYDMKFNLQSAQEIAAIISNIMTDPVLHAQALRECEDLYSEQFYGVGSEFLGSRIIEDNFYVDSYLHKIYETEKRFQMAEMLSVEQTESSIFAKYLEIIAAEKQRAQDESEMESHYARWDDEDWDDEAEENYQESLDQPCEDRPDYSNIPYIDYDYSEVNKNREHYLQILANTTFALVVNYKGEAEFEDIAFNIQHLRKFNGKYDYD